jgi:hypothetical protein
MIKIIRYLFKCYNTGMSLGGIIMNGPLISEIPALGE